MSIFDKLAGDALLNADTSYPVLAAGLYEFRIKEAEQKQSESGFEYLNFVCELISDGAFSTTGEPIAPNYVIRHMVGLTPSDKAIAELGQDAAENQIVKRVATFLDGFQATRHFDESLQSYIGQTFFAKTKVSKEREDKKTGNIYPPNAEIATIVPKAG